MTCRIVVTGVVQGVGFRPFVARAAEELSITGSVKNCGGAVEIAAQGTKEQIAELLRRMKQQPPSGAMVLTVTAVPADGEWESFTILPSGGDMAELPILSPDLPVCDACLRELSDPANRRYRYPFISCTACGPRYSILEDIPYDRETTTMADYPLCADCAADYCTPDGRRRHAQTVSCHHCGPQLLYRQGGINSRQQQALADAVEQIRAGHIIAVKGVGGYQLICSPYQPKAAAALRKWKGREKKPFAVMLPSVAEAERLCVVEEAERELLQSAARPIVLLRLKKMEFAAEVSGDSRFLGVFLPYTPLHQLLIEECGPLVVTSANKSGEPLITQDAVMQQLAERDGFGLLWNTRRITAMLDDSVARVISGQPQLLRRSRGYVPLPLLLNRELNQTVLAAGGDLKAGFCLMQGNRAYLSQYFGDMASRASAEAYRAALCRMERLLGLKTEAIVCDLHPGYHTVQLARELAAGTLPLLQVQHHHAHILSVMAEHGLDSCIGVAFDGTGYGTDGNVWGGEFLLCRGAEFERMGCLEPIAMTGGDAASQDAGLSAMCQLRAAGLPCGEQRFSLVCAALAHGVNVCQSSSVGRLFDAVSYLLGLRQNNSYEGECAIALENCAAQAYERGDAPYPLGFEIEERAGVLQLNRSGLLRALIEGKHSGADIGALALGFHVALAAAVEAVCRRLADTTGERNIALSGGVFGNRLLLELCIDRLKRAGLRVFWNRQVPPNDSGICLGQAWYAVQREKKWKKDRRSGHVCGDAG